MLRRICNIRRSANEPWHEWIQRATRRSLERARAANVRDWVQLHARRKWQWAGHVARMCSTAWARRVTMWRDADWTRTIQIDALHIRRPAKRRWMKWEDALRRFMTSQGVGHDWTSLASDRTVWSGHEDCFASNFLPEVRHA